MIPRRRRSSPTRTIRWTLLIPVDLAVTIENAMWDPVRHKPSYGMRNQFVIDCLRERVERDKLATIPPQS